MQNAKLKMQKYKAPRLSAFFILHFTFFILHSLLTFSSNLSARYFDEHIFQRRPGDLHVGDVSAGLGQTPEQGV